MIDLAKEIAATHRSVGAPATGDGVRTIRLARTLDAPIEDVWDAVSNPTRISRWFLPISGEFRVGGHYQLEGNAGGTILACEAPRRFRVTWVFGAPEAARSELEIRLAPSGPGRTDFELEHTAAVPHEMWDQFGPGAVGVGWDGALLGLSLHVQGHPAPADPVAWQLSDEGRAFSTRSSEAWGDAYRASGANDETVANAAANTTGFYAPDPGAS
jgi:uncharacterized protein YndB with AHSA1/START domain